MTCTTEQFFTALSTMLLMALATNTEAAPAGVPVLYVPAAIASPPHAGTVNFTRLQNAIRLNYENVTELYVKVVESEQAVLWIMSAMLKRLPTRPGPHTPCFTPQRSAESLSGFDIQTRLMEDATMLFQFNSTLQDIIGYENFTHGGEFVCELADIFEKYKSVMEGLMNLTVGAEEMLPCSGEMDPLSPPPTSDQDMQDGSTRESDTMITDEDNAVPGEFEETDALTRCTGDLNLLYVYEDLQELFTTYWYIQLDLLDIKQRLSPHQ